MADSDGRNGRNRGPRDRSLRAGDGDREAFAAVLREQHLDGRLDSDEFQERLDACMAGKTYADLDRLGTDPPGGETSRARAAWRPSPTPTSTGWCPPSPAANRPARGRRAAPGAGDRGYSRC